MAEISGSKTSTASISSLGFALALSLQTYIGSQRYPEDKILELAHDVTTTAGVLRQLQDVLESDRSKILNVQVLKDAGRGEIANRADQCERLYKTIVAIVVKAGTKGGKGREKIKTSSIDTASGLTTINLVHDLKWSWLEPRIKRSQEQLAFLKMNLLLLSQASKLAELQLASATQRVPGVFEQELASRILVERLRHRLVKFTKTLELKHKIVPPSTASSSASDLSLVVIEEDKPHDPQAGKEASDLDGPKPEDANVSSPDKESKDKINKPPPYSEAEDGPKKIPQPPSKSIQLPPMHLRAPPPPPPPPPPGPTTCQPLNEKKEEPKTNAAGEIVIDASNPLAKATTKEIKPITLEKFEAKTGSLQNWFKSFFGSSDKFIDDVETRDLEAYMILEDDLQMKVPFGHRRLKFGLKKAMKKRKTSMLEDYYKLPRNLQIAISDVLRVAQIKDSRNRICICFDVLTMADKPHEQNLLVFFQARGSPIDPIHLKDAVGRKYSIPFHAVQSWEEMKNTINLAFLHVAVIGVHVAGGRYDLIDENGEIVMPELWPSACKPGASFHQLMWPLPDPPRPPPPNFFGPPRPQIIRPPMPPIIIERTVTKKKNGLRRRSSYSTFSSFGSDSSAFDSDSDIEDEDGDRGIEIDYEKEREKTEIPLGELLRLWTNAIDTAGEPLESVGFESDSSSSSSTSLRDD